MPDAIISLNQTLFGAARANVICFNNVDEDTTFLITMADALRASFETFVEDVMSSSWTLEDITVSFIEGAGITYSVVVPFTDGPLTGLDNGEILPPQSSLLIRTAYVGVRPNRGRNYFFGLTEVSQANGLWDAAVRDAFEAMVQTWADGLAVLATTVFLRILRRPSDVFPSYVSSPVSTVARVSAVKTQRRRQR